MPLLKKKSNKALQENIKTEMDAHPGKSHRAQNLAIAYSVQKKARKAKGGKMEPFSDLHEHRAEGGFIGSHQPEHSHTDFHEPDPMESGYESHLEDDVKHNGSAMSEDDRMLNQHGEDEIGPEGAWMSEGGQITDNYQSEAHEEDMVGDIMKHRQHMYSKGGQIANDTPLTAGREENNFDDLVLRNDDMEDADYTGENSGDQLGNEREDEDREDMIDEIMKKRKKGSYPGSIKNGL